MAHSLELEELVEHFTLYPDETRLLRNKSGATRLGFSLILKFLLWKARFPRGRGELPDNVIEFVAGQVGVPAADIGFYDWDGRQVKRHRAEIRRVTGFRECSVADAENLTAWLAVHVCCREQRADRVREELLGQCRAEKIEPPAGTRIGRIIGSALQRADDTLMARISGQIPPDVQKRMVELITAASDDPGPDEADGREVFAAIRSDPGNVSLNTAKVEVAKLASITAIGLPGRLFAGIAPRVLAGWRARVTVEAPSHLRAHPDEIKFTLLAAYLHCRQTEITDTLIDLLITIVHRINAHAEQKVVQAFLSDYRRVTGKENILFKITEAAVGEPGGLVRDVVYPAAGGVETLIGLLEEYQAKGGSFRQARQKVFKASYTSHYRSGLIALIGALEFRSTNTAHAPVLQALELIKRYKAETTHNTQYYARGEQVPLDGVVPPDLRELLYKTDKRGRPRILRSVYECGVFQTLREKLRCKEIWVTGAGRWRNPDDDLPKDFEANRAENYQAAAAADLRLRDQRRDRRRSGRRARPHRGRPALRTPPVLHRGGLPRDGPRDRQRDVRVPAGVAVGSGNHRGRLRLHPLHRLRPEHLHRMAFPL